MRILLPLRVVTPIVGGGVEAMEPDAIDVVRVPEIRGVLRWWWRALFQDDQVSADDLFRKEAMLWGGVDVPFGAERRSFRSRVRLQCRIVDPGRVMPAGVHEPGRDGRPRAFPTWTLGSGLGYALFPLQRSNEERQGHAGRGLPTRSVRSGVRFELEVKIPAPGTGDEAVETDEGRRQEEECWHRDAGEVLKTLWAWVNLGGLGARTRRGFGALGLDGEPSFAGPWPADDPPGESLFGERFDLAWRRLCEASAQGSRVRGAVLLQGPSQRDASAAHELLVKSLWTFRQGVGFAREPAQHRPGRSRWPEADLLRALRPRGAGGPTAEKATQGAPRAAFGMPLIVQFKDARSRDLNGTLVPGTAHSEDSEPGSDRWASPLILRPSGRAGGDYRPLAIFLGGERPGEVFVKRGAGRRARREGPFTVESSEGAKGEVKEWLAASDGDVLRAFASWLGKEMRFQPQAPGGGS